MYVQSIKIRPTAFLELKEDEEGEDVYSVHMTYMSENKK